MKRVRVIFFVLFGALILIGVNFPQKVNAVQAPPLTPQIYLPVVNPSALSQSVEDRLEISEDGILMAYYSLQLEQFWIRQLSEGVDLQAPIIHGSRTPVFRWAKHNLIIIYTDDRQCARMSLYDADNQTTTYPTFGNCH